VRLWRTTPPVGSRTQTAPRRGASTKQYCVALIEESFFELNLCSKQHLDQFPAEWLHSVMLGLIRDVLLHRIARGGAYCKSGITVLPGEVALPDHFMDPHGSGLLEFTHEIGQAMRCFQAYEKMDMVRDPADFLGKSAKPNNRSTHVFMQSLHPVIFDEW